MQLQNIHGDGSAHAVWLSFPFDTPSVSSQQYVTASCQKLYVGYTDDCLGHLHDVLDGWPQVKHFPEQGQPMTTAMWYCKAGQQRCRRPCNACCSLIKRPAQLRKSSLPRYMLHHATLPCTGSSLLQQCHMQNTSRTSLACEMCVSKMGACCRLQQDLCVSLYAHFESPSTHSEYHVSR